MFKPLSRRTIIRGACGVAIGLPFLEAMQPQRARAADAAPKRLISFWTGNGQIPSYWVPTGTETAFTFNKAHVPLEPYKSRVIVIDGINNNASKDKVFGGHQGSHAAMFSGVPPTQTQSFDTMRPGGPSLDQLVADKLAGKTKLKSLQTGVDPGGDGGNPFTKIASWRSQKELLPPIGQPARLFDYLFMDGLPNAQDAAAAENLRKRRKSILDTVADRFSKLRVRVGTDDKLRLDNHLSSIREIEQQVLATQAQTACMIPSRPADNFNTQASNIPAWGKLQMDLMVLALACDLTRVASFMWIAMGSGGTTFSWLGHTDTHHNLAHASNAARMLEINTWYSTQLAYLMGALEKNVDVGGGSMLDSTLIVWWNELGDGAVHSSDRAPFVLAGGAGGALKMGRFLSYPSRQSNNNLLLSVYNAVTDSQDTTFGDPRYCTGPLSGL
jgi:hypothetical protein